MLEKQPYVPTGVQIGEITDDRGTTLGVLTFHTNDGEFSFCVNRQAADVLQGAVEKLRLLLSSGGTA